MGHVNLVFQVKREQVMRHDATIYRQVCPALDKLFKDHGDKAGTAIRRYLRIRTETRQTESRIKLLEAELDDLKSVDDLSRRRRKQK